MGFLDPKPPTRAELNATYAPATGEFSANAYGAGPAASWTVNRDAFQAANDAAAAFGGGRVIAKAGNYQVKGIIQDGGVEFHLPGVTLTSPDGLAPSVITARTRTTTGTIAAGSASLTVTDATHVKVGSVVAIRRAGGILDTQNTTITGSITASQTTGITLTATTAFPTSGVMQSGTELISYTGISAGTLTGVTRGALGTTAATHAAGDVIGLARSLYAEVTAVAGTTATLDTPAVLGVTGDTVTIGALRPGLSEVTINGNKVAGGAPASTYAVSWSLVRWGSIRKLRVNNGDMGGLIIMQGSRDNTAEGLWFHNCGITDAGAGNKGSSLWLYQGVTRNRITGLAITGDIWVGVYIDDRTTTGSEWDSPCNDNTIDGFIIKADVRRDFAPAFLIIGSNRNKFLNGSAAGTSTGFDIGAGDQGLTWDGSKAPARDNEVGSVTLDVYTPWLLNAPGNRVHDCTYTTRALSNGTNPGGNLIYASSKTPGGPALFTAPLFGNGSPSAPSIGFEGDTDTGFFWYADNTVAVTLGGARAYTFYPGEFRVEDGKNITVGTGSGTKIGLTGSQKLGFFGKTPMTQPPAIANQTGQTLAQVETELNLVKTTLRNLGLIAT